MIQKIQRALLFTAVLLAVIYLADYASASFRPQGSVQVQPYTAMHLKGKKIEYDFSAPPEMQACVASLLPHSGLTPCWYLKGHTQQRIDE